MAYELRDTVLELNVVCPDYTKTNFTNFMGGKVNN
jgi:hypothetical protein